MPVTCTCAVQGPRLQVALPLYTTAKSTPIIFSMPGVLICSIQVAGLSPSRSLGTPGMACSVTGLAEALN